MLKQDVCVVLVDFVSIREFNLYAELLELTGQADAAIETPPPTMYAVTCRWRPYKATHVLEAWSHVLSLNQPLPVLPLWLNDELAVPLDLESSYEQTCRDLRIA